MWGIYMKIAVVVDSTSYLSDEIKRRNNIYTIPLNTIFDDEIYREDIDITPEEFYDKMRDREELPTTSQPSIGDYIILLEDLHKKGYTDVISLHLSGNISGTIQNAVAAGQSVDGIEVHPIDSDIACTPLGLLAVYAAQQKDKLPLDELLERLERFKSKEFIDAYFVVDDLTNLKKGGRLSNAQAFVGQLLKIKPILRFEDGKIVAIQKIRTKKKALNTVVGLIKDTIDRQNVENEAVTLTVIHANIDDEADEFIKELEAHFKGATVLKSHFGPVIGTHLGEKAIGVAITSFNADITGF